MSPPKDESRWMVTFLEMVKRIDELRQHFLCCENDIREDSPQMRNRAERLASCHSLLALNHLEMAAQEFKLADEMLKGPR